MIWFVFYRFTQSRRVYGGRDEIEADSQDEAERTWRAGHPNIAADYLKVLPMVEGEK